MSPGAIASAPASAEESAGITPRDRGSHSSGIREATQYTTRYSWPNAVSCSEVRWWPTTTDGQQSPDVNGLPPAPHKKTSHATGDGIFRLGTHDA